jgi:pyruvate dehydrogenase E1 component
MTPTTPPPGPSDDRRAVETREWLDSLDAVLQREGPDRVGELLRDLSVRAAQQGVRQPFTANTPYLNTIHASQ